MTRSSGANEVLILCEQPDHRFRAHWLNGGGTFEFLGLWDKLSAEALVEQFADRGICAQWLFTEDLNDPNVGGIYGAGNFNP